MMKRLTSILLAVVIVLGLCACGSSEKAGEDGAQVGPEAAEGITRIIRSTRYTDCALMDEQEALEKASDLF